MRRSRASFCRSSSSATRGIIRSLGQERQGLDALNFERVVRSIDQREVMSGASVHAGAVALIDARHAVALIGGVEFIVSVAAVERVGAISGVKLVVAGIALRKIVGAATPENVVATSAHRVFHIVVNLM